MMHTSFIDKKETPTFENINIKIYDENHEDYVSISIETNKKNNKGKYYIKMHESNDFSDLTESYKKFKHNSEVELKIKDHSFSEAICDEIDCHHSDKINENYVFNNCVLHRDFTMFMYR